MSHGGYTQAVHSHDRDNVDLYIPESFTFRLIESRAAIELRIKE